MRIVIHITFGDPLAGRLGHDRVDAAGEREARIVVARADHQAPNPTAPTGRRIVDSVVGGCTPPGRGTTQRSVRLQDSAS